uniref:RNA transcription, translation and transport factor protein n=1 Tax=Leptobrachium leishanense TaxID=445787 RepID=A0A8C5PDY9_9ANUR
MFRRKLQALDYHNPAGFNCKDETEFRNFIVWLEDQKIRHYKIEERGNLRNIHSADWTPQYDKYLKDLNSPFKVEERQESIDWLLGLAVRLEYGDNAASKYQNVKPLNAENSKSSDPLINLDVGNPDFKAGVMALANLLQIQRHDDYLVMLKAIRILVQERLSPEAVAKSNSAKEDLPVRPVQLGTLDFVQATVRPEHRPPEVVNGETLGAHQPYMEHMSLCVSKNYVQLNM